MSILKDLKGNGLLRYFFGTSKSDEVAKRKVISKQNAKLLGAFVCNVCGIFLLDDCCNIHWEG